MEYSTGTFGVGECLKERKHRKPSQCMYSLLYNLKDSTWD